MARTRTPPIFDNQAREPHMGKNSRRTLRHPIGIVEAGRLVRVRDEDGTETVYRAGEHLPDDVVLNGEALIAAGRVDFEPGVK